MMIGYNISNFDLPYLLDRAKALKVADFAYLGRMKGKHRLESNSRQPSVPRCPILTLRPRRLGSENRNPSISMVGYSSISSRSCSATINCEATRSMRFALNSWASKRRMCTIPSLPSCKTVQQIPDVV